MYEYKSETGDRIQPKTWHYTMRGKFIVLEGLDRSGKSTQVARLVERLQQDGEARLQKFPGEQVRRTSLIRPHDRDWQND